MTLCLLPKCARCGKAALQQWGRDYVIQGYLKEILCKECFDMAKKSDKQKIVDRLVRTLEPFTRKKRLAILKAVMILCETDDEEDEVDPEWMEPGERDDAE